MSETTINPTMDILMLTLAASSGKPRRKNPNDEYRYYHCRLDWDGLECKKVEGSQVVPKEDYTKLLFVKRYFPERLDKHILKYKWLPETVTIRS